MPVKEQDVEEIREKVKEQEGNPNRGTEHQPQPSGPQSPKPVDGKPADPMKP